MSFLIQRILSSRSEGAARHFFNVNGYNKYGFYHDDLIGGYNQTVKPNVAEAYRRLAIDDPEAHDRRVFRAIRASQLKIQKKILPESEWITFEEDQEKGYYLRPYLEQIEREEKEKKRIIAEELE